MTDLKTPCWRGKELTTCLGLARFAHAWGREEEEAPQNRGSDLADLSDLNTKFPIPFERVSAFFGGEGEANAGAPETPRARGDPWCPPAWKVRGPTEPHGHERPPLLQALQARSEEKTRTVLELDPASAKEVFWDHNVEPPLCAALRLNCGPGIVGLLLEHGANPSAPDVHGVMPFAMAHGKKCGLIRCRHLSHAELDKIMELVLEAGAKNDPQSDLLEGQHLADLGPVQSLNPQGVWTDLAWFDEEKTDPLWFNDLVAAANYDGTSPTAVNVQI